MNHASADLGIRFVNKTYGAKDLEGILVDRRPQCPGRFRGLRGVKSYNDITIDLSQFKCDNNPLESHLR